MAFLEVESNNTQQTANSVAVNTTFQGSMGANGDLDFFKIAVIAGGRLTLDFTHPNGVGSSGGNIRLQLSDSGGNVISAKDFAGNGKLEATVFVTDSTTAYDGATNNTVSSALGKLGNGVTNATTGAVLTGSLGANADSDFFKVQSSSGGQLTLDFTHPNGVGSSGGNIRLQLSDSGGNVITSKDFQGNGKLEATAPSAGDYFVTVIEADSYTSTFTEGIYSVRTVFVTDSTTAYDGATNNTASSALEKLANGVTNATTGAVLSGSLGANADSDFFKVQSSDGGRLTLDFTHPNGVGTSGGNIRLQLSDSGGNVITSKDFQGNGKLETTVPSAGDYFVTVIEADSYTSTFTEGIYSVGTVFVTDSNTAYDGAANATFSTALSKLANGVTTLTTGAVLAGSLGANADLDFFKVQLGAGGRLTLDFTHPNGAGASGGNIRVQLSDSAGTTITSKDFTGNGKLDATMPSAGTYFVTVIEADSYSNTFTEGVYSIRATTPIDEAFLGTIDNNTFTGGTGNDSIDGGAGVDLATFGSTRSGYTISKSGDSYRVVDTRGTDGTDTLYNIERLQFSDKKLAFDLSPAEHGGQTLQFLGVLAPSFVNMPSVVGAILGIFDQGKSLKEVCQFALDIGLVTSIAGTNTNAALAAMVFRNVIGSEADAATVDLLVGYMDGRSASFSQADFMTFIAGLDQNLVHIGLVGLQQTGLEFN
jgi:serralysin